MKPNRTVADRPVEPEPVQGTIRYTRPISERLHIDVRDFKRTNMQFEPHRVPVRDARAMEARLSLDVQGFVLTRHASAVAGSRDVLPQRTGLLLRFGERSPQRGVKPARFAHLDYTTEWARRFVTLVTGWESFTPRPYRRFAIYQTWRATSAPPQDNTLALCDGRSVAGEQTMEFDVTIGPEEAPGNTFVSRVCRYDEAHRWHYFPSLTRDEVIVFKAFDSAAPDALNVAHTAFDDPLAPADAVPRSSIEARFVAFFD